MRPSAAFAVGLWTGAVVVAAVGVFYLHLGEPGQREDVPVTRQKLERRIQSLEQEQARAQAEESRLKQTITDLQTKLELRAASETRRQARFVRREIVETEPPLEPWIVEAVAKADAQALPRLEQTALAGNLDALDALALLAEQDNGEALTRVWSSGKLSLPARQRATMLLAATAELNPHADELLRSLFTTTEPQLQAAALDGLLAPDFQTRLQQGQDIPSSPFRPDPTFRLKMLEGWRAAATDETAVALIDSARDKLAPPR